MERRLIYRLGNGPSEQPVAFDSPEVVPQNQAARERLAYEAGVPAVREAIKTAENEDLLRKCVSRNFEDVPLHVNSLANGYAAVLPPERQQHILSSLNAGDTLKDELGAIMETITTPVQTGTGDKIEHRYLRAKEAPEGYPSWYGIDFRKVEADMRIVAGIKAANPELASDLAEVERALSEYARPDPSLPMDRWGLVHRNATDTKALGMAKFAAIIVAASAAVLTGVIALGRKEGFKAPLLYAGIAGLLAFPDLRRSIFGTKADNILAQVDTTVNARDFKENVRTYDIAGPQWQSLADSIMRSPADTKTFLKELSRLPANSPQRQEKIDEYVNGAMPEGEGREQLRRMITDKNFSHFAQRLMSAKNEDARDVVLEYIGRGAGQFEHLAERKADDVNRVFAQSKKGYLSGNLNASEYR